MSCSCDDILFSLYYNYANIKKLSSIVLSYIIIFYDPLNN